ncbi:MAG TPA: hypothetical protein VFR41_10880 [Acidimicrobiia bacterium]|nr:hypothetical protein [Acidimicrobiia bacterium]
MELHWRTTGTSVDLFIDGQKFASFKQPNFDGLEYFACNGNSHTYKLVAHGANGQTATKTITLY